MVVNVPFVPVVERSTLNPLSLGELSSQPRLMAPGAAVAERLDGPFWLAVLANDAASASGASGRSGSQAASAVTQTRATNRAIAERMGRLLGRLVNTHRETDCDETIAQRAASCERGAVA